MKTIFKEEQLQKMPDLYEQDGKGDKAKVYLRVNLVGTDYNWLLTEYCKESKNFFGFACLNDIQNAELGYINRFELDNLGEKYPLKVEELNMELRHAKAKYIFKED